MINQIFRTKLFRGIKLTTQMNWVVVAVFLVLGLGVAGALMAEDGKIKEVVETKEIIGRLSSRSPINEPKYIGIIILDSKGKDSGQDMFFSADDELKVQHKKKFSDINIGDTIKVVYDEITQVTEDGGKRLIKRVAKIVKFVRAMEDKKKKSSNY